MADQEFDWDSELAAQAPTPQASPETQPSSGFDWERELELHAKALGQGASALVALPGDVQHAILGPPPAGTKAPFAIQGGELGGRFPTSADLAPITNALGITGTPKLVPQSPTEEYSTALVGAAPAAAAAILTGGAPLPSLLAAGTGALAGEAGHQLLPDQPWAGPVAALLTGLGFGSVAGWLSARSEAKAAATALADADARLESASQAKIEGGYTAKDAASAAIAASKQKLAATKQLTGLAIAKGREELGAHFETTAADLGSSSTVESATQILQNKVQSWLDGNRGIATDMPDQIEALAKPIKQAIPTTMTGPISQFRTNLSKITSKAGDLEDVASVFTPKGPAQVEAKLAGSEDDLDELLDGTGEEKQYNFADMASFRSRIGAALSNPKIVSDIGQQNASFLYSGLTQDMRVMADRAGVLPQFDEFNAKTSALYDLAKGPVTKVLSGEPGDIGNSLLSQAKKGGTVLDALRQVAPEGVDELAAAHLRTGGPGAWAKLSPEAKLALVPNPQAASSLETMIARQAQVEASAQEGNSIAAQEHADTVSAENRSLELGNRSRAAAVRAATKARDAARAALPLAEPPSGKYLRNAAMGLAGATAYTMAPEIANHLDLGHSKLVRAGLTAVGAAAPFLSPARTGLSLPLTSVLAGSNQLELPQPDESPTRSSR